MDFRVFILADTAAKDADLTSQANQASNERRPGRMTITRKFVGLSVVLLAIMLAAAIFAFVQSARVNRDTALLVDILEPLKQEIVSITQATAEEALASERALRYGGPQIRNAGRHADELALFERFNTEIDGRLSTLTQHILAYEKTELPTQVAIILGRLQLESETVRREHAAYRDAVRAFLAAGPASVDGPSLRETAAMESERRVVSALERMTDEAAKLSSTNEVRLSDLEHRSFIVSIENLVLAIIAFLVGSLVSVMLTRRMLTPVRSLIAGAEEIGRGNLEVELPAAPRDEIGQLSTAFSEMIDQLRNKAAMVSIFILAFIILGAFIGPFFVPAPQQPGLVAEMV